MNSDDGCDPSILARMIAIGSDGLALRIEFFEHADRVAHRIVLVDSAGRAEPVVESVEGDPRQPWPASPALQALNRDQLQTAGATGPGPAVLVGMSGRSHWSLAIEPGRLDGRAAITFDAACRVKLAPPTELGSCYRLAPGVEVTTAGEPTRIVTPAGEVQLESVAVEQAATTITADGGRLHLGPSLDQVKPPVTLRWKYRMVAV